MRGKPIGARRALEAGLVNHVVPLDDLMPVSLEIANDIAANSAVSMKIMKRLMAETANLPESEAWEINDRYMHQSMQTEAFLEGPRAFVKKHRPEFSGR